MPLVIASSPDLRMILAEARTRRSAFLREAVRALGLQNVEVETARVGRDWRRDLRGRVDLVTIRAVRPDDDLWMTMGDLMKSGVGRVLWFVDLVTSHKTSEIRTSLFHVEHESAWLTVLGRN